MTKRPERANEQPRSTQEHNGKRDFHDDERGSNATRPDISDGRMRASLERLVGIRTRGTKCRQESEQESCDDGQRRAPEQSSGVEMNAAVVSRAVRKCSANPVQREKCEAESDHAGDQRQHETLGEYVSRDTATS